jgi:TolA-binding protein
MRVRLLLTSVAVAATALVGVTGSALGAGKGPEEPPGLAVRCERFDANLTRLQERLAKVEGRIARLDERLAGEELSEKQTTKVTRRLAKLERAQEKLTQRIGKLSEKIAKKCGGEGEADTPDATEPEGAQ